MSPTVSGIQLRILTFIDSHVKACGYAPSYREIGDAVGLTSTSTVHHHLTALEWKGYLRRSAGKVRALKVTFPEEAA